MAPAHNNPQVVESEDEDYDGGNHSADEMPTATRWRAPKPSNKQKEMGTK